MHLKQVLQGTWLLPLPPARLRCGAGSALLPEGLHPCVLPALWGSRLLVEMAHWPFLLLAVHQWPLAAFPLMSLTMPVGCRGGRGIAAAGGVRGTWPQACCLGGCWRGGEQERRVAGPPLSPSSNPICPCLSAWLPKALMHVEKCQGSLIQLAWVLLGRELPPQPLITWASARWAWKARAENDGIAEKGRGFVQHWSWLAAPLWGIGCVAGGPSACSGHFWGAGLGGAPSLACRKRSTCLGQGKSQGPWSKWPGLLVFHNVLQQQEYCTRRWLRQYCGFSQHMAHPQLKICINTFPSIEYFLNRTKITWEAGRGICGKGRFATFGAHARNGISTVHES